MAPSLRQAKYRNTASGLFSTWTATRSPRLTPRDARRCAKRPAHAKAWWKLIASRGSGGRRKARFGSGIAAAKKEKRFSDMGGEAGLTPFTWRAQSCRLAHIVSRIDDNA